VIYISVIILGGIVNFIRSPSFTLIPKLYSIDVAGQISGIHNTFASLGALVIPLFIGYIRDITFSYNAGWIALSALLMLGAFTNLFLKKPRE
jgi:MFS-type transporter involved in bile tolerance (Atg22 family)